jgi:glycosidase
LTILTIPLVLLGLMSWGEETTMQQTFIAADKASMQLSLKEGVLKVDYHAADIDKANHAVFVAIDSDPSGGSAVVPFAKDQEGSSVFLPFFADRLYSAKITSGGAVKRMRLWKKTIWSGPLDVKPEFNAEISEGKCAFDINLAELGNPKKIGLVVYAKDLSHGSGWGRLSGCSDSSVVAGEGDKYIPHYYEVDLRAQTTPFAKLKARLDYDMGKTRIYQLYVRVFGNTNETRKPNGTLVENGAGRFNDINDAALSAIKEMGFTHIWLTGVLQQATATDYTDIGEPADDPDLLKGLAGSPYAVKDYFDVCPDYAEKPAERLAEFKSLLDRMHAKEMRAIIDLVPNHVARSYHSDIKPELDFGLKGRGGEGDDPAKFFDPQNNFFYLRPGNGGPPLKLPSFKDGKPVSPTCKLPGMKCDGLFEPEKEHGKVTGNNVVSWTPDINDWYETVKLNYGFDFTDSARRTREYPHGDESGKPIPDTWLKMDQIIAYWQSMGVDGFRCDMSHMVPAEFWSWATGRARQRNSTVFFMGEAYDDDPAKVGGCDPVVASLDSGNGRRGNVMFDLLNAGFNAVYDHPAYKALKNIYDGSGWANDLDRALTHDFIFQNSLRYAENHDEARLAGKSQWNDIGMEVGRPVSAVLYGLSRGPVMLYNGQEVGEPASGAEGFGGDDARTSLFDYWSMPELVKWVNDHNYDGGKLSEQQKNLRAFYGKLVTLVGEPAFRDGAFFRLNPANNKNMDFGATSGEPAGGHWMYAFLRFDPSSKQRFLVVANFHKKMEFKNVRVIFPAEALEMLDIPHATEADRKAELHFVERLGGGVKLTQSVGDLAGGLKIPSIPPLTPYYIEIETTHP